MGANSDDGGGGRPPRFIPPAETIRPDRALQADPELLARHLSRPRRGSLLTISGAPADVGLHQLVEGEVVIGRELEGLKLHDGQVSRRHVVVRQRGERYLVRDLGSTNGTRLNGEELRRERALGDGDRIGVGTTEIKFMLVDETEAAYLRRIARIAGTDELTGLVAKHRFDALLAAMVQDARQRQVPLCAMMMDMDNLKALNDRHGHQVGAGTISRVGRLIGELVAGHGEACRFGGDEFSAYLIGLGLTEALALGEQIRAQVAQGGKAVAGIEVATSISIGVAALEAETADGEALLARADRALYRAKEKGRNCVSD